MSIESSVTEATLCEAVVCDKFNNWENLTKKSLGTTSGTAPGAAEQIATCNAVSGCIFEQIVEIRGVENA